MAKSSLLDIQKGLRDKLIADTNLMALITGVFDDVPLDQLMPYIEIGEATEGNFHTFDKFGREVTEVINIYSGYAGYKEGLSILGRVVALLDYEPITLTDFNLVYLRYEDGSTNLETMDEGRTRRVSARFRAIVQEK